MLSEIYQTLSYILSKNNIPYLIIGGQATLLYMEPRFTYDIDITIDIDIKECNKIFEICKESGWKILVESPYDFILETMVLPVLIEPESIRIDFIFSNTKFEREAINHPNIIEINGVKVNFCSLEYLIVFKIFSGRQRDLDDVNSMLRNNRNFNVQLIEKHLLELGSMIDVDLLKIYNNLKVSKE